MAFAPDKIKRPGKQEHDHKTGNAATGLTGRLCEIFNSVHL